MRRYAGKRITPTATRSSFAYYFREKHPERDAVLANIQWVQYPSRCVTTRSSVSSAAQG
jgi:hypothetical protein